MKGLLWSDEKKNVKVGAELYNLKMNIIKSKLPTSLYKLDM